MTLEVATYINQLNSTYPEGSADRASADDHLRLIKAAVKATFPSVAGAVSASHTELNLLVGTTETVGAKLVQFSLSISAINTSVAGLGTSLNSVSVVLAGRLTSVSAALQTGINTISNSVSILSAHVAGSVSADLARFSLSISAMNSAIALLGGGITADLDAISNTISVMAVNIAALSNSVSVIDGRLTSISALNTTQNARFTSLSAYVTANNLAVTAISNTVSVIAVNVNTLSASVATLNTNVATISLSVLALRTSVSAISTRVNTLSVTVSAIQANLALLSLSVSAVVADVAGFTATQHTWSAQQIPHFGSLTDSVSIAWDCTADGQIASVTLAGNRVMQLPTNIKPNAAYVLVVRQDVTGSRSLSWTTAFLFPGGYKPTLSTAASSVDIFTFIGGTSVMYCVGVAKGLA